MVENVLGIWSHTVTAKRPVGKKVNYYPICTPPPGHQTTIEQLVTFVTWLYIFSFIKTTFVNVSVAMLLPCCHIPFVVGCESIWESEPQGIDTLLRCIFQLLCNHFPRIVCDTNIYCTVNLQNLCYWFVQLCLFIPQCCKVVWHFEVMSNKFSIEKVKLKLSDYKFTIYNYSSSNKRFIGLAICNS
jgi:hypothetical protein